MEMMGIDDVVEKLVGPIQPVGETYEDKRRLENAQVMTNLIRCLLYKVKRASEDKDRVEYSMRDIGKHCEEFLEEISQYANSD